MPGQNGPVVSASVVASIPSPGSGTLDLGPFQIHAYGLTLLAGDRARDVRDGASLGGAGRRLGPDLPLRRVGRRGRDRRRAPLPPRHELGRGARRVVGARARSGRAASASGAGSRRACLVGGIVAKRAGADVCAAGRLPRARAPARAGASAGSATGGTRSSSASPTDLPWGLEIDPGNRPLEHLDATTFHPTFLYEALWNLLAAAAARLRDRATRPAPTAGALRRLRRAVLLRPVLGRAPAHRRRPRDRRAAGQRLGLADRARRRACVWYVLSQRRGRPPRPVAPPKGPTMAVPKGRKG